MLELYYIPLALLLLRLWLGFTFMFQATDKLFYLGIDKVVDAVEYSARRITISRSTKKFFITLSCWLELAGSILLILGMFKMAAFIILGVNMLGLSIAFSMQSAMWDMKHFFPRFIGLILLMMMSAAGDLFSVDNYLFKTILP